MNVHVSERIPWQDGEGVRKVLNEREHSGRVATPWHDLRISRPWPAQS